VHHRRTISLPATLLGYRISLDSPGPLLGHSVCRLWHPQTLHRLVQGTYSGSHSLWLRGSAVGAGAPAPKHCSARKQHAHRHTQHPDTYGYTHERFRTLPTATYQDRLAPIWRLLLACRRQLQPLGALGVSEAERAGVVPRTAHS
jgi:hypothetical protein